MSLLDIIYCYVNKTIPFTGDFSRLRESFIEGGFKETRVSENKWKYTRGAGLALEFNYNSEAIQMQVFLERPNQESLTISIGNWGFPFEPLLMKKRFIKNLHQIVTDISTHQQLQITSGDVKEIENEANKKFTYAIILFSAVIIFIIVENLLW